MLLLEYKSLSEIGSEILRIVAENDDLARAIEDTNDKEDGKKKRFIKYRRIQFEKDLLVVTNNGIDYSEYKKILAIKDSKGTQIQVRTRYSNHP